MTGKTETKPFAVGDLAIVISGPSGYVTCAVSVTSVGSDRVVATAREEPKICWTFRASDNGPACRRTRLIHSTPEREDRHTRRMMLDKLGRVAEWLADLCLTDVHGIDTAELTVQVWRINSIWEKLMPAHLEKPKP